MGTYLYLSLPGDRQSDEQVIDEYYDYVASKERDYFRKHQPNREPEKLQADRDREFAKEYLDEDGEVYI